MNKSNEYRKEKSLGYLIASIARQQANQADRFMEKIGLYRGQAILLVILSENDGLSHSELAEKLKISPAAVTKVIKRLEKLNYLQRQADSSDERVSRVYLKAEGWAVINEIQSAFQVIDQILLRNLSSKEQSMLFKLLQQVQANLLAHSEAPI